MSGLLSESMFRQKKTKSMISPLLLYSVCEATGLSRYSQHRHGTQETRSKLASDDFLKPERPSSDFFIPPSDEEAKLIFGGPRTIRSIQSRNKRVDRGERELGSAG